MVLFGGVYFRGVIFWGVIFRGDNQGNKLKVHLLKYCPFLPYFNVGFGLWAVRVGSKVNLSVRHISDQKSDIIKNFHKEVLLRKVLLKSR